MAYLISKENIKGLLNALLAVKTVYAPKKDAEDTVLFEKLGNASEWHGDSLLTHTTAKDKVYLQSERFFKIKKDKNGVTIEDPAEPEEIVIFGGRPCDARGFEVINKLFNWSDFVDEYYTKRMEKTTIITISCEKPESTCFCTSFSKGSPVNETGSDLLLTPLKDGKYLAEAYTDKGKKVVSENSKYFNESSDSDLKEKEDFKTASETKIVKKLNLSSIKKLMEPAFDSVYWDTAHLPCVKCGACTFVCPTCYCFDITEKAFDNINSERVRSWDTCMSEIFTRMAGGVNPRSDTKKRFRQRFMHKFNYHVDNFKEELCTGCGRCIKACPVSIDVRKVIEGIK
ncbi:MAG: 4Fe-4S dicluster domain-containing protein [Candidatus Firestonebacteria bacterium]